MFLPYRLISLFLLGILSTFQFGLITGLAVEDIESVQVAKSENIKYKDNKFKDLVCKPGQFRASYYNNRQLRGVPKVVRCEDKIEHDWSAEKPVEGLSKTNYSVEWSGLFDFEGGNYNFTIAGDDQIKVEIDNQFLSEITWRNRKIGKTFITNIQSGQRNVRVTHIQGIRESYAYLKWEKVADKDTTYNKEILNEIKLEERRTDYIGKLLDKSKKGEKSYYLIRINAPEKDTAEISKVQQEILSDLGVKEGVVTFRYTPAFGISTDFEGLLKILNHPKVSGLTEEEKPIGRPTVDARRVLGVESLASVPGLTGKNQVVGIIDNGVDARVRALSTPGKLVAEACFSGSDPVNSAVSVCPDGSTSRGAGTTCNLYDLCEHGTPAATLMVGNDTRTGFKGMAPDAKYISAMSARYYSDLGFSSSPPVEQIRALEWLYENRNTTGLTTVLIEAQSYQTYNFSCDSVYDFFGPTGSFGSTIIDSLRSEGIVTVVPAGNFFNNQKGIGYPACVSGVLSVGAANSNDQIMSYSYTGDNLDVYSVTNIPTVGKGGANITFTGTSAAGPSAAGAIMALREAYPKSTLSVDSLENAIKISGKPLTDTRTGVSGLVKPRVDVQAAFTYLNSKPITDLAVSDLTDKTNYLANEKIEYTIKVENKGSNLANDIKLNYAVPPGIGLISSNCPVSGTQVSFGDLTPQQSTQCVLELKINPIVNYGGSITLSVENLTFSNLDSNQLNNTSSKTVLVSAGNAKIAGKVFTDINNNGKIDNGEMGIANIRINIFDDENRITRSVFSDSAGNYSFDNLYNSTFRLAIVRSGIIAGLVNTTGNEDKNFNIINQISIANNNYGYGTYATNQAPVIGVNPLNSTTKKNVQLDFDLSDLAISDPDSINLKITFNNLNTGSEITSNNGVFVYKPGLDFTGIENIEIVVDDNDGNIVKGLLKIVVEDDVVLEPSNFINPVLNSGTNYSVRGSLADNNGNVYRIGQATGPTTIGNQSISVQNRLTTFVAKYDSIGNVIWVKSATGTSYNYPLDFSLDGDGNLVIVGVYGDFGKTFSFESKTISDTSHQNMYLLKINADSGSSVFLKSANLGNGGRVAGMTIDQLNNIYIHGAASINNCFGKNITNQDVCILTGNGAVFTVKYDKSGFPIWAKSSESSVTTANSWEGDIAVDTQGNVYITGNFNNRTGDGTLDFDGENIINLKPERSTYLVKYNTDGVIQFAKNVATGGDNRGSAIAVDVDNNIYVAGYFSKDVTIQNQLLTNLGQTDIFISKFNPSGQLIWAKGIGGSGAEAPTPRALRFDNKGNLYLGNYFTGVLKLNNADYYSPVNSFSSLYLKFDRTNGDVIEAFTNQGTGNSYTLGFYKNQNGNLMAVMQFNNNIILDTKIFNTTDWATLEFGL